MIEQVKTSTRVQNFWCDPQKHTIKQGEVYVVLSNGGTACLEHANIPLPEVLLAGSHE